MSSLTVQGDLKYLLFIFLGIMVSILVLGYHHSPTASPSLGARQLAQRNPTLNPNLAPTFIARTPVSTEYAANTSY